MHIKIKEVQNTFEVVWNFLLISPAPYQIFEYKNSVANGFIFLISHTLIILNQNQIMKITDFLKSIILRSIITK